MAAGAAKNGRQRELIKPYQAAQNGSHATGSPEVASA